MSDRGMSYGCKRMLKKRAESLELFFLEKGYLLKDVATKVKVSNHTIWRWQKEPTKIKQEHLKILENLGWKNPTS